ncbi:MAG: cation transporter, partial [Oscillospiraceae bacterium]|nr:cation transporter [Oscillospiraceae bacterium]
MENHVLRIQGMACAACAQRIEKTVGQLSGVGQASVNLASEQLFVECDASLPLSSIKEAVAKIGYAVLDIPKTGAPDEDRLRKQKEIRTLWTKFIVAAAFTLPLLYIAMAPMLNMAAAAIQLPFPTALDPMDNPLYFALIQLLLLIPVIGVGHRFYTGGFKSLVQRSPNMDSLIAIGTTAAVIYSIYGTWQIANNHFAAAESLYF